MTEHELKTLLSTVTPPDETARAAAHAHWAALAKPLGGLGLLKRPPSPVVLCWCCVPITAWWPRVSARRTPA